MAGSNLAKKIDYGKRDKLSVDKKNFQRLTILLSEASRFIENCRNDLELLAFLTRFEDVKYKRKGIRAKIRSFVSSFPSVWRTFLKDVFDYALSFLLLVVLSPLFLGIALVVKLTSPGPVFYKQARVGKGGKFFTIYKFRSMKVDAENISGPTWAKENDPRLTPIGGFLRKSHLDELPQLINVLKGDMSIIGPRPERPYFVGQLKNEIPGYLNRLDVKPGITGLAQVRNRYDETIRDVKKKIRYDLLYIRKMCLLLDLKVAVWTLAVMITGKGAR